MNAKRWRYALWLVLLVTVAGCDDDGTGLGRTGSIALQLVVAGDATGSVATSGPALAPQGHLQAARATLTGPTPKTVDLTATATGFTATITGLTAGTYGVTVEGLVNDSVDYYGQATSVQVRAGQSTTASISFASYRPSIAGITTPTTAFTVIGQWAAVNGATGYDVQWAPSPGFTGAMTTSVTNPLDTIARSDTGTVYVRARAKSASVTTGRWSNTTSFRIAPDLRASGDNLAGAPNLGFGTAINATLDSLNIYPVTDVDIFKFSACQLDTLLADMRAERLTPPSPLDGILDLADSTGLVIVEVDDSVGPLSGHDPKLNGPLPYDGTYYVAVSSFASGSLGRYTLEMQITPGPYNTGSSCQHPDLRTTTVTNQTAAVAGDLMRVDVTFDNLNTVATAAGWRGRVVLSTDNVLSANDPTVQTWIEPTVLGALGSHSALIAAQLPDTLTPGAYYVGVIADATDAVLETNEGNNVKFSSSTVAISAAPVPTPGGLAALNLHTCRLDNTGAAKCWGDNLDGELGDGTLDNVTSTAVSVAGGLSFVQIVTGAFHTCGLTAAKTVYCWGWNGEGQLGDPSTTGTAVTAATRVATQIQFVRLAAGQRHTCGIDVFGQMYCWGQGSTGQLGDGNSSDSDTPVKVGTVGSGFWKDVAAGDSYTCGIDANAPIDGTVYCWGDNTVGQVGDGTTTNRASPVASLGPGLRQISISNWHACGINNAGNAYCWGLGADGELGDNNFSDNGSKVLVAGGFTWKAVVAGQFQSCGIRSTDEVWCWGYGQFGELGDGTISSVGAPTNPVSGVLAKRLALGFTYGCAQKTNNTYVCWGRNNFGQLGNGATLTNVPHTANITGVGRITAAYEHSCATKSGTAWCWGNNGAGRLGDNGASGAWSTNPVSTGLGSITQALGGSAVHTCAIQNTADIYCWGLNSNGQLGDGTFTDHFVPTLVNDLGFTFLEVSGGDTHTCALRDNGAAYCWGANGSGQLGNNSTTSSATPVVVSGGHSFQLPGGSTPLFTIATGFTHSCGIDTGSHVWCWGDNAFGQLGDGTTTQRLTPVQAGSGTYTMVTAGYYTTCAVATNGVGRCWGLNNTGQVGDGTYTSRSSPTQISGGIAWTTLSTGVTLTCGLDTGGQAYCWGPNFEGSLGDGTFWDSSTPVAVQSAKVFVQIIAGRRHVCGVANDGTVQCWGRNRYGQLGDGTQDIAVVPVSVLPSAPAGASRFYMAHPARTRSIPNGSALAPGPDGRMHRAPRASGRQ